jgi:filamentous hemagglutinin family protein
MRETVSKNKLKVIMIASAFSMISFSFFSQSSFAQNAIAPDNTLPANTLVDFNSVDKTYTITGGKQVGANQFHSFQNFSVPTSNTAHFNNSDQTTNVIGRITGSNISDIDGLIKANGAANLYLINPNGFLFGKNAKLEIGGSFSASTATSLKFPDGSEFSATNPQAPPVLTVNVPLGLQYGVSNTGATISNQANLVTGQDLVLNADKLDLQGQLQAGRDLTLKAQDRIQIRDTSISPFVAAAGRDLLVQGNQAVDIFALNNRQSGLFSGGNMLLRSPNSVIGDVHYYAGGNFKIEQLDGSLGNLESPNDPIIRSAGDVTFGLYQGSSLHILAGGRVNIGTVIIFGADTIGNTINPTNTPTLANVTLSNGETLTINGSTRPTLDIRAGMNPSDIGITGITGTGTFTDPSGSFLVPPPNTNLASTGTGITIGDITFLSSNGVLLLTNTYKPNTSLSSEDITITGTGFWSRNPSFGFPAGIYTGSANGNGGSVFMDSRGSINLDRLIFTGSIAPSGVGGNVTLLANNNINFGDNAQIFASSTSLGGQIDLKVNGEISGRGIYIASQSLGSVIAGNSGDINITAATLSLSNSAIDRSQILTSTSGVANAGKITLNIIGDATFDGVVGNLPTQVISKVFQGATGVGGNVEVKAANFNLQNGAQINSITEGLGKSGDVKVTANNIKIDGIGSAINNQVSNTANANGGKLTLNTGDLTVTNQGQISTFTDGIGNGGELNIIATGNIVFDNSLASSGINPNGVGNGGNLLLNAKNLQLLNGGQISAGVFGQGNSGNIKIESDTVSLSGTGIFLGQTVNSGVTTSTEASTVVGNAGDIDITTRILNLNNNSFISAATSGQGNAGNININASESIFINNSYINNFISTTAIGKGGNLNITSPSIIISDRAKVSSFTAGIGNAGNLNFFTQSLFISNNSELQAYTNGIGNAGDITISSNTPSSPNRKADNTIQIDGSSVSVDVNTIGRGTGGTFSITSDSLQLLNGAQIGAGVYGKGDGGKITIHSDKIILDGSGILRGINSESGIYTSVDTGAIGNAGVINVKTRTLDILNQANISAETRGLGNAGKIEIRASDVIFLSNGTISNRVNAASQGDGGDLKIVTNILQMTNQSFLNASTASASKGGNIDVTANRFEILSGSRVGTNTSSSGAAGNISLILTNLLRIDGKDSGIFAGTNANSTGQSGTIFIDPELVTLTNGAKISVSSLGTGNGGNIQLIAGLLSLDNASQIIAETASGEGGNIVLQVRDLLWLRNGSLISATAGNDGNGGNIDLSANFILAFAKDNSDITANAFKGKGGNIRITTQAIFGMQFRPRLTPLSDITASSDFGVNGTVNINTPGVDPSKGLTNLPVDIGDASKLVSQKCLADRQDSAFVITGRGGIPASPADVISGNNLQENLGALNNPERIAETTRKTINPYGEVAVTESLQTVPTPSWARQLHSNQTHDLPDRIVEAQGWTINPYGEVSLVAEVPKAIAAPTWAKQLQCR